MITEEQYLELKDIESRGCVSMQERRQMRHFEARRAAVRSLAQMIGHPNATQALMLACGLRGDGAP